MNTTTQGAKQENSVAAEAEATPPKQVGEDRLAAMGWLPCTVTVEVRAVRFTIEKLLRLSTGMLVESGVAEGQSVPVQVNGKNIALSDIETAGDNLAFRVTEIL